MAWGAGLRRLCRRMKPALRRAPRRGQGPAEVPSVCSRDIHAMTQSRRRDPEVVGSDQVASCSSSAQISAWARAIAVVTGTARSRRSGARRRGAASPHRTRLGAVHPMQELTGRDDADRAVLVADRLIQRHPPPLGVDQHRGIDQDGHALIGGPMASRPASTSCAKFSSGEGADPISSRHLAGGPDALGWPIASERPARRCAQPRSPRRPRSG